MAKRKDDLTPISILKANVQRTNDLGDGLIGALTEMENIKNHVIKVSKETEARIGEFESEMTTMVEEVRNEREITYEQQKQLQSIVHVSSNQMTREYYEFKEVSSDLFKKKKGQFISAMWKRLKNGFDVPRYTSIRKVDFDKAVNTLKHIDITDINENEIEDKRSWNIPGLFSDDQGDNRENQ